MLRQEIDDGAFGRPGTGVQGVEPVPQPGIRLGVEMAVGRLKTRSWETPEGDKRTVTEIDATEVAPSLKWTIASPQKVVRARTSDRSAERGQFNDEPPS